LDAARDKRVYIGFGCTPAPDGISRGGGCFLSGSPPRRTAIIVAGAYSAEVALATKAGSHSHKENNFFGNRMVPGAIARF